MWNRRLTITPVLVIVALTRALAQTGQASGMPVLKPETQAAAQNRDRSLEVLRCAQQAAGGLPRLLAIRDITRAVEMVSNGATARQTVEIILPDTIRLTNTAGAAEITAFFDGISGWIKSPWGVDNLLPPWQRTAAEQDLMRQLESLLQSDHDNRKTVEFVESAAVGDRMANVLKISTPVAGNVRLAIDAVSCDSLRLEYTRIGPRGPGPLITDFYSDYRKLPNGLRMPFRIRTLSDGKPYMETVVTSVEYNRGLRAEALSGHDSGLP